MTDFEYTVLQLLRTRTDNDKDVRFAVREKYPHELAKQHAGVPSIDRFVNKNNIEDFIFIQYFKLKLNSPFLYFFSMIRIIQILKEAKPGENLKRILNPNFG